MQSLTEIKRSERQKFWLGEIELAEKHERAYREEGKRVWDRYRVGKAHAKTAVKPGTNRGRYHMLYANTQLLRSSILGRVPQPDVSRRYLEDRGETQIAADVLEKVMRQTSDETSHGEALEAGLLDDLLNGRGLVRVVLEDSEDAQRIRFQYWYWEHFCISPARAWGDVWWIAYRHPAMRKDDLKAFLAAKGFSDAQIAAKLAKCRATVTLGSDGSKETETDEGVPESTLARYAFWEIWNKTERKVLYLCKGSDDILHEEDAPFNLEGFFDCRLLISNKNNDSLLPTPEYASYEALAKELDDVTLKLGELTSAVKVVGVADNVMGAILAEVSRAPNLTFKGTDKGMALREGGGLAGSIWTWPLAEIVQSIQALSQRQRELRENIDEMSGVSDVMRAQTDSSETLGAQQLKASYGSLRQQHRRTTVQRWVRDLYEIEAEIVAEHFDAATLEQISGVELNPQTIQPQIAELGQQAQQVIMAGPQVDPMTGQAAPPDITVFEDEIKRLQAHLGVEALLRNEKARPYRIDVSTDEMAAPDRDADKAEAAELGTALSNLLMPMVQIAQMQPAFAPVAGELIKRLAAPFKMGRAFDESVDTFVDALGAAPPAMPALPGAPGAAMPGDPAAAAGGSSPGQGMPPAAPAGPAMAPGAVLPFTGAQQ